MVAPHVKHDSSSDNPPGGGRWRLLASMPVPMAMGWDCDMNNSCSKTVEGFPKSGLFIRLTLLARQSEGLCKRTGWTRASYVFPCALPSVTVFGSVATFQKIESFKIVRSGAPGSFNRWSISRSSASSSKGNSAVNLSHPTGRLSLRPQKQTQHHTNKRELLGSSPARASFARASRL